MKGTPLRRVVWAGGIVLAGVSIGSPVAAQDASPSAAVQTTQPVEQEDDEIPWGLLGLLGLGGLAGLRRREEPRTVQTTAEGAKTYSQR